MESKGLSVLILLVMAVVAIMLFVAARNDNAPKGYQGQSDSKAGFWNSLWNNAANIVDAGGRHTAATVTATGNAISAVIATSKTGKNNQSEYGYSDPKQNYGPYILGGAVVVFAVAVAAIMLIKK